VVLATSNDLQVWDVNLQQQLFEWQLSTDKAQGTSPALCYRGVSLVDTEDNACLLCVGSSTGVIHTFEADRPDQIHHSYDLQHHTSSIAALASGQTLGCSSTTDGSLLASCDDGGGVTVFQANSANDFAIRHTWEGHGVPCVSVAFKDSKLLAAFYDGSVRLYSLVRLALLHLLKHAMPTVFACCHSNHSLDMHVAHYTCLTTLSMFSTPVI